MDCNRIKILLVEDNLLVSLFEKNLLVNAGHEVVTAVSGEEAIKFLEYNSGIDLVMMDVDLGDGMSGVDAATIISARYSIPLIFYTGHEELDLFLSASEIEKFGYIPKNARKIDVINMIDNVMFIRETIKIRKQLEDETIKNPLTR